MEALLDAVDRRRTIPADLKEQAVLEHEPLIRYIVNRLAVRLPNHIDLDDLYSTGAIGLMDAIEKFDPSKGCKFKTYAEFRIKGAVLDQFRSLDWVPRSVRQKGRKLEQATASSSSASVARPTKRVADSLGLDLDKFHTMVNQVRGIAGQPRRGPRNELRWRYRRHLRRRRRGRHRREPLRFACRRRRST